MVLFESEYLRQTVGPTLAGGCAATAAARPADPVEHLANWLLRSVLKLIPFDPVKAEAVALLNLVQALLASQQLLAMQICLKSGIRGAAGEGSKCTLPAEGNPGGPSCIKAFA